ncbi:hypothetical protein Tco_0189161 [Tanacetum coccineum]
MRTQDDLLISSQGMVHFDKSKGLNCFNCQKLGRILLCRECRFAKYQGNRANGQSGKEVLWLLEDSKLSKPLVATDNNEDIDWTKEFDAEHVTYAMMATDWNGLGDFDWRQHKLDDAPFLALMATNSEGKKWPTKHLSTSPYRSRVPQAVLSRSTDRSYYPRMNSRRPRISSYSPSSRSSTTRTPHRPQRPKKIVKSIWVKKGSTVGSKQLLHKTV